MTKEEFNFWKNSPETQEVFQAIQLNIDTAVQQLTTSAGVDPLSDRYNVGAIAAYRDMLLINFEEFTSVN